MSLIIFFNRRIGIIQQKYESVISELIEDYVSLLIKNVKGYKEPI